LILRKCFAGRDVRTARMDFESCAIVFIRHSTMQAPRSKVTLD